MRAAPHPALPLAALAAHGLPARALEVWRAAGVETLLPLQQVAVAEYGVLQGRSAIVLAPTSAGKTLIAELAALRHLEARRRVIYLVPTRALAEERGEEFRARFGALGARVVVATRERPEADAAVASGAWDVLVAIYEKARAHLAAHPALLGDVGLVAADEMQLLGELGRGDAVELILTKIARSPHGAIQFLGLSAVLGDAVRLGAWLRCDVLTWPTRPVELREGVLCAEDGVFRYHAVNADAGGEERQLTRPLPPEAGAEEALLAAAQVLVARGEPVLVFAPTKRLTRAWAQTLAERLALPPAEEVLRALETAEPSQAREALEAVLRAGVAFHNADLAAPLRRAIERAYDCGEVRALVATSTLAQGVNLTGRNVLMLPVQVETDRWTGEAVARPLALGRFHNAGGRAGRLGREREFGRAILVAATRDEAERLMHACVRQAPEPLRPGLEGVDLVPVIVDLVACAVARCEREIHDFLLGTYTGLVRWQRAAPGVWDDLWLGALERAERAKLLARDAQGDLAATGLGREVARAGVSVKTAQQIAAWLDAVTGDPAPLEVLWCACRTRDGAEAPVPLTRAERQSHRLIEQLAASLEGEGGAAHPMTPGWLRPEGGVTPGDFAAAKRALVLTAWLGDAPTADIEAAFGVQSGAIEMIAGHVAWIVETMASIATAFGHPDARTAAWRSLARRLPRGLPAGGLGWAEGDASRHLGRAHVRALLAEGFASPGALRGVDRATLARLVPAPLAEALTPRGAPEPPSARSAASAPVASPPPASPLPQVDAETGTVHWLGRTIRLTAMPARLLALLAARAPEAVSYREIEDALWGPGSAAERQQISFHARRAVRALRAIDALRAERLIETRAGQGLRLRVEAV